MDVLTDWGPRPYSSGPKQNMDKSPWDLFGKNFSGNPFGGSGNPFGGSSNPFANPFGETSASESNKSAADNEANLYLQIAQHFLKKNGNKGSKTPTSEERCQIGELVGIYLMNANASNSNCTLPETHRPLIADIGEQFYAYVTPIIIVIGLIGNSISLNVFTSKGMRKQSASYYLAALSTADLLVLVVYVLFEWIRKGLRLLPGHLEIPFTDVTGVCHVFLYLSYVFRFLSVWLLVIFTFERYIGVCHPLKRRKLCTKASARRIILGLVLTAMALPIYKPALSEVRLINKEQGIYRCTEKPEYSFLSFCLDASFGLSITLIPFLVVLSLNTLIVRKLFLRKRQQKLNGFLKQENKIRIEFTVILLSISTCFILLNLPYFVFWCYNNYCKYNTFNDSTVEPVDYDSLVGILHLVKAIFYINYCINFFLYSITGAYFRKEMKMVFSYKFRRNTETRMSRSLTSHTPQSWV
ncbi:probable G-protein coupled receptor 139 [Lineus longissimus]|uniref:probable G-protein coupled receptor 139 n=1 Tax=Lineus longissimus TaxID=88925 RepID=UPI00315D92B6